MRVFRMARMQSSLHGQQYQSSQLFIHWSVRLVVPHTEHLGLSSGADFLTVWQMPWSRSPMKIRTTILVITPLQYNDSHVGRGVFALSVPGDGAGNQHVALLSDLGLRDICACDRSHSDVRPVPDLRMAVAKADVIKASRHPRFRPVGDGTTCYLEPRGAISRVRFGDEPA
jgi:hypothetical protein